MPPSTATADPTAVQNHNRQGPQDGPVGTGYPSTAGLNKGASPKRRGLAANPPMTSGLAQLMEEPPGGPNHGRTAPNELVSQDQNGAKRWLPLGTSDHQAAEFLRGGGWRIVTHSGGEWNRSGGTAHRGVLHPDEHVDTEALQAMVEHELGFSYGQVRSVYRQGRLTAQQRELRGAIDARLLALSRSGANLMALGRLLGFEVDEARGCQTIRRALRRAEEATQ